MQIADVPAVNRILKRHYEAHKAPVVEFIAVQTRDPFKVLVTTILSARTKDETTTQAAQRLFSKVGNMDDLRAISETDLAGLIFPVGFYRTKARHLKQLPDALQARFGGVIPSTVEELCELPGVGRKTANLVVAVAFDKPAICVDVHVHRICNRLGLLDTKDPFETEMTLRKILPTRYWITWNSHLVSFGQTLCHPLRPECGACPIRKYCDRVGVTPARWNAGDALGQGQ
jgi:endonuclease III